MCKTLKIIIFINIFIFCLIGVANGANIVDINSLIENSKTYDKTQVTVQGEAISEIMERGNYAWININDKTNAIGIWLKLEDAKKITTFGDYKHKGDIIKVTGEFHRDCSQHGGDVDIHNSSISIVEKGNVIKEDLNSVKIIIAIMLISFALIVLGYYLKILNKDLQKNIEI